MSTLGQKATRAYIQAMSALRKLMFGKFWPVNGRSTKLRLNLC
jgi:hypothetical protein